MFRGKTDRGHWIFGHYVEIESGPSILSRHPGDGSIERNSVDPDTVGQFIGDKAKGGKMVFEGDIRLIIADYEGEDTYDWYVCTWIQEWTMFAWLHVVDEYFQYLKDGLEALDEPLFWTYPAGTEGREIPEIVGNIYDNPELLKAKLNEDN